MAGPKVAASWTTTAARVFVLLLCTLLTLGNNVEHTLLTVLFLAGLAVLTAVGSAPLPPLSLRLLTFLEAAVWAWGVMATGSETSPLLPYLMAPAFVAGLRLGLDGVLVPVSAAAVAVLSATPGTVARDRVGSAIAILAEWVALSLLVGFLGTWVRTLELRQPGPESYLQAHRLLAELRAVSRRLPAGLDRSAVGEAILREASAAAPTSQRAALYVRSRGPVLELVCAAGVGRRSVEPDLAADTPYAEAWSTQTPAWNGVELVLPLLAGDRTTGLLVLDPLVPGKVPEALRRVAEDGALRLESALLFDELREVATVEERHRLGREIHDGVAQDLAAFGYQLDGLAREAMTRPRAELAAELTRVRADLGRLVVELRQSIFELRADVRKSDSLGGALSEFAHAVGASNNLAVHLSLDEATTRLPADVEAELLRIAQEAVGNSRKHAMAENIWIRCEVAPPRALIVVEDDGVGSADDREYGFGMQIMRERAARLNARLDIDERSPRGTIVRCEIAGE